MHLQLAKWITEREPAKRYLIVAPLGVRQEFTKVEGPAMGLEIEYCRTDDEVAASRAQIIITNYERVRDGNLTINPDTFAGAGLDEAAVLRSFGSKTYQGFLQLFKAIPFRFVFTATPSPNRHKELIHYAAFLGVMDSGDALTRFFKRDSEKANNLTLYPHQEEMFWRWLSSWAVFIQRPSDLGYDDTGYDLPKMNVHWHRLAVDHTKAWAQTDSWGQAQMFLDRSTGLKELAEVKRETVLMRLEAARRLMAGSGESKLAAPAAETEDERIIDAALNHVENQHVLRTFLAGEPWGKAMGQAGCAGRDLPYWFGCAKGIEVGFRSDPATRLIPPARIKERAEQYKPAERKHWLLWHDLEIERYLIEKLIPEARTAYGSQDLEEREEIILGFSRGEFTILATKPVIAGSGCNFQRHCADAVFLGSSYKFHDVIQAVHRIYRFQQAREVNIHFIFTESEDSVIENLKQKWAQHDELVEKMAGLIRQFGLSDTDMKLQRTVGCDRSEVSGDQFRIIHNDSIQELADWPDNSVDQIVTSIPFGNQYEYSPSVNDMGHNPTNEDFFRQMDFLIPNLLRVLKPGRVACIHVKDRIRFGNVTGLGMPTVDRFSDKAADRFEKHGFAFMGRITIDTDVVRENNQTYRLGWTENSKDSTKMGVGMPEYVLILRKLPSDLSDAYADLPVTKDKSRYTRAQWQIDASSFWRSAGNRLPDPEVLYGMPMTEIGKLWRQHCMTHGYDYHQHVGIGQDLEKRGKLPAAFMLFPPISRHPDVWTDIARMRVLNSEQSKRQQENHVCPLQLDIVERLINRYSNPGEIVMDPFAGIGTVPYLAIKMGRHGLGIELSEEYWQCAVGYCEQAEAERSVPTLFDLMPEMKAS
jgi:DNA modification methylase